MNTVFAIASVRISITWFGNALVAAGAFVSVLFFSMRANFLDIGLLKAGKILVITFLFTASVGWAQSPNDDFNRHRVTLMMANSHVRAGDNVNQQGPFYIVPTWCLNYDYWLAPEFAIGLHNDVALQQFKINVDDQVLERSYPVIVCAVFIFKPFKNWTFLGGGGREFEKHENFNVITAGVEYGIELRRNWELNVNVAYDHKINAYDSWLLGIGVSKLFSCYKRSR